MNKPLIRPDRLDKISKRRIVGFSQRYDMKTRENIPHQWANWDYRLVPDVKSNDVYGVSYGFETPGEFDLTPLRSFVLPGGSALAAHLHLCRTVARRAERLSVELSLQEMVNPAVITYLNRLSDWFFVASRVANDQGASDVLWVPGANR